MPSKIGSIISLEGPTASGLYDCVQSRVSDYESIFAICEMETLNVGKKKSSHLVLKQWHLETMETRRNGTILPVGKVVKH